jgi:hypothetical protein
MKKITFLIMLAAVVGVSSCGLFKKKTDTDVSKQEQKFVNKFSPEVMAENEAKDLEKKGFEKSPSDFPIEYQLYEHYKKKMEKDNNGLPVWFTGSAFAKSKIKQNAIVQASFAAKQDLAQRLKSEYRGVIEGGIRNNQLSETEAEAFNKIVGVGVEKTVADLQDVTPDVKVFRNDGGLIEAYVAISYNSGAVKKKLAQELEQLKGEVETRELREKYDDFLNPEKLTGQGDE